MKFKLFLMLVLSSLLCACTATEANALKSPAPSTRYVSEGKAYTTEHDSDKKHYVGEGKASYYHTKFNGKRTASGEKHDSQHFTAAHRTLPFGTHVLVTNVQNNKQVVVRINDRGPFTKGRVIDMSKAAAAEIGLVQAGVATVRVEQLYLKNN